MNNRESHFKDIVTLLCFFIAGSTIAMHGEPLRQASSEATSDGGVASASAKPVAGHDGPLKTPATDPGNGKYTIGSGDILAINVWKDSEISRSMPVRPDGHISLPLIGEIQAAGLTASELQEQIEQRLQVFVSHPQVNVIVQEIRSRSFNIIGKVIKPGAYDLKTPTTVLDAIALAGGFQDFARVTKIYILRRAPNGSSESVPFNYKQAIKGVSINQNVELQPGDTIVVP